MGNASGMLLEENLAFSMVDFFKEHEYIIKLGLANSPSDVNTKKFYRIVANDPSIIKPDNTLQLRNARVICDGKLQGLGCDGVVAVTHPLLPSPDDHLLLKMNGSQDELSTCSVTCTCGTAFYIYANATVGNPDECYLAIVTTSQPETARFAITPFFEIDRVDILGT